MGAYDSKPWLKLYGEGKPHELELEHESALGMFESAVERAGDKPALHYFDATITWADADRITDGLAVGLRDLGVAPGDRVAVYLQNVPQWVLAAVAIWKAGGVAVSVNPMYREREVRELLTDSGATGLITLESLYGDVVADLIDDTDVRARITTSELDFLEGDPPRLLETVERERHEGTHDLLELARSHEGEEPEPVSPKASDVAFLVYTSGTTGPPKGARNTHGNVVFTAQTYRDWVGLTEDDVILGVAPLFHVTGLIAHLAVSLLTPAPLVLFYRFDPAVALELIEKRKITFTMGAITVFLALLNHDDVDRRDVSSLSKICSGGAPISPATVDAFEEKFGAYIHNVYGLTETTSPSHAVPFGTRAPVDEKTGALAVGVPVFGTVVKIVGEDRQELPVGEVGEIVTIGPQVVDGYWEKSEETEKAMPGGALHTGDVGFMDENGWFFLVDRKKDQINASGYKVWPREVEDVLYEHPAVHEAAVVGVPHEYRGETVKAYVSLKGGKSAEPDELIAFCKKRMAAYKYPREVELLDQLPKTESGKILRRELRDRAVEKANA
jgi:long-chain acyl-CoA synthetase